MKYLLFVFFIMFSGSTISQETIGLVYNDEDADQSEGYTLFKPTSDDRTFLINNCGEVINTWSFSGQDSRNCYLLETGELLQSNESTAELRDWNNNVLWNIDYQSQFGFSVHHDIEPLPNGNFLVLVRDIYSNTEMFLQGMDSSYPNETLVLEKIIEIEPSISGLANIVWEWKLFDHLIQEVDSNKPNFGIVSDNPHLLDMNYKDGHGSNPIHANAINYNQNLDQIAVSARHLSEVFVIDHSTTTSEAAGHNGGTYGHGGDILWRWGNPEVYNQGTITDRKLGKQHDIKWITEGPNQGKMSVFSNEGYGSNTTASSVHIIDQSDTNGFYTLESGKFLPNSYFWSWDGLIMDDVMHASAQCGMQIMSNGNALVNESDIGRISEIDNLGNVIWVYIIPAANGNEFEQFEQPIGNGAFRANRYPTNYQAFDNRSMLPIGIIENENDISQVCSEVLSSEKIYFADFDYFPNPTRDILYFKFRDLIDRIEVFDISGKLLVDAESKQNINLKPLSNGIYIVKISSNSRSKIFKIIKM